MEYLKDGYALGLGDFALCHCEVAKQSIKVDCHALQGKARNDKNFTPFINAYF